ncbi:MAG: hypothetical protein IJG16_12715, partial [Clostridia bacterium]|nr:hypothetical protein [Clostridia bacterium]
PMLLSVLSGKASKGLNFKIKYNANGYDIDGTIKLLNPQVTVDMQSLTDVDCNLNFVTSVNIGLSKTSGKDTLRLPLGTTHIPIGTTGLFVDLELFFDINASGKVSIVVQQNGTIGMKDGKSANSLKNEKLEVYADAKASVSAEIGASVQISLLEVLSIGAEGGFGLQATATVDTKEPHICDICIDGDIQAYLDSEIYLKLGYGNYSVKPIDIPGKLTLKGEDFYISIKGADAEFGFGECPYKDIKTGDNTKNDSNTSQSTKIKVELAGNGTKYLYDKDIKELYADFETDGKKIIIEHYYKEEAGGDYGAFRVYDGNKNNMIAEYTGGYKTRNYAIIQADGKWFIQEKGALSGAAYYTIYELQGSKFREVTSYSKDHQDCLIDGESVTYEEYENIRKHYDNVIASTNDRMFNNEEETSATATSTAKSAWYPTCPSCSNTDMYVDPNTGLYMCRHCDYIEPDYDRVFKCPDCGSYNIHCLEKSGYIYAKCYDCERVSKYSK